MRAEVVVTVQMAAETEATEVTVAEADAAMVVETMRTDSNNQQSGSDSGRDRGRGGSGGGSVVAVVIKNPRMDCINLNCYHLHILGLLCSQIV